MNKTTLSADVPPATDLEGFFGLYAGLFSAVGIKNDLSQHVPTNFSHPIPESNKIITEQFVDNYQKMRTLRDNYQHVEVLDARTNNRRATFIIGYSHEEGIHDCQMQLPKL